MLVERQLSKVVSLLDKIAGFGLVLIMLLIVISVLTRTFSKPLIGTDEYTGFILACVIGLALANCAIRNGHIAVDMVVERFSPRVQAFIDIIIGTIAVVFWSLTTFHIGKYAYSMAVGGEVSMTTTMPYYPFIYVVAFGVLGLAVVALVKVLNAIGKVVK